MRCPSDRNRTPPTDYARVRDPVCEIQPAAKPLIRLDMEDIIDRAVPAVPRCLVDHKRSMLAQRAESLRSAGLKRVNVSIDSLDPAAFQEIRKGQLAPGSCAGSMRPCGWF